MNLQFYRLNKAALAAILAMGVSMSGANALEGAVSADSDMRIGPGAEFPLVGKVPADTDVSVNGCTGGEGWCVVRHDGRHGWVPSSNVNITGISRNRNDFDDAVIVINVDNRRSRDRNSFSGVIPYVVEQESRRGSSHYNVIRVD